MNTPKRLSEDVCELLPRVNKLECNLSSIDTITNEVDWILCKGDGGLIVHQRRCASLFTGELVQQPVEPNSLARGRGHYDVLCLTG
jgi:hypothetical protein